jgi:predicted enzyme related to lactoylglutathione lyase
MVFIYVADLEGARRFYEQTVGLGPPAIVTGDWVQFDFPQGAQFALHRTHPEAISGVDPSRNTIAFSLMVEDLAGTCAAIEAAGATLIRSPEMGQGFRLAEIEDPEGNRMRLIEPLAAGAGG